MDHCNIFVGLQHSRNKVVVIKTVDRYFVQEVDNCGFTHEDSIAVHAQEAGADVYIAGVWLLKVIGPMVNKKAVLSRR